MPLMLAAVRRHMQTPSQQAVPETDVAFIAAPPEAAVGAGSAAADATGAGHPAASHRRKLVVVHPAAQQADGGVQGGAEGGAASVSGAAIAGDRDTPSDGEPATSKSSAGSAADGAAAPLPQQEVLSSLPMKPLPLSSLSSWDVWSAFCCQK